MPTKNDEGRHRLIKGAQVRMVLRGVDRRVFLKAVSNIQQPSHRLVQALRRHRALATSGSPASSVLGESLS